jgi:O-antigen ligase
MTGALSYRIAYEAPSRMWERYLTDPSRLVIVLLTTFMLGYGARRDNGSPFTMAIFEPFAGGAMSAIEIFIALIIALEFFRRLMLNQWWLERSPVSAAVVGVGIISCLYPALRMFLVEGTMRVAFEMFHLPMMIAMVFVWLFVYRREELPAMLSMVLAAGLFKAVEGVSIFVQVGLGWGLLTGWRDGMLLTLMMVGPLLAFAIKPEGDRTYNRIRIFLFASLPLSTIAFMGSLRRSYMLGVVLIVLVLAFYLKKSERRALVKILPLVLVMAAISMAMVGWGAFIERFSMLSTPSSEGSATYRVFELYNVTQMVLERPYFGWPMAAPIENYTLLDIPPISTIMPHNIYLYVIWRSGILGLVAWLVLIVGLVRMHLRTIRAAQTPFERFTAFLLATSTGLVIFTGFTTPVAADRLQIFYPFIIVMTGFLPGAWSPRKLKRLAEKRT